MNLCLTPMGNTPYSGTVVGAGPGLATSEQFDASAGTGPGIAVIRVTAKTFASVTLTLNADFSGTTQASLPSTATVRFKAKQTYNMSSPFIQKDCTIVSRDPATITLDLTEEETQWFGTWVAAFQVFDVGKLIAEYPCYYQVEVGLESLCSSVSFGSLAIGMVRTALLDWCRDANTLLQDLEFPDWMILAAITRPIDEWNATPPELEMLTPTTFPWREPWLRATCSILLEQASHKYERNRLPHNAGGLSMDPNDKGRVYFEKAMLLRKEWKDWICAKKTEINMNLVWGGYSNFAFDGSLYRLVRL